MMSWIRFPKMMAGSTLGEVDPVEEMGVGVVTKVAEEEGGVEAVLTKCLMLGDHYFQ